MARRNVLWRILRRSRSRGPRPKVGWLVINLFIFNRLGEASKISGEKFKGGSRVTIERICDLSGKISKTKEVDKEAWK